jgi:Flp pilus assembly protein TadD
MSDLKQKALAALLSGRWDEAEGLYRQILSQAPQDPDALHQLAVLAWQRGRSARDQNNYMAALIWLRQAIALDPQVPEFHVELSAALHANRQYDQALVVLRQARQKWPNDLRFISNIGFLLYGLGDVTGAAAAYRDAVRVEPGHADTRANLAMVLLDLGELEEAKSAIEEALRLDPRHPEALGMKGQLWKNRLPPEQAATAREMLADPNLKPLARGILASGLALVHDADEDYARAAELTRLAHACFREDAQLTRQMYYPERYRASVEKICAAYTPEHFQRVRGWGNENELPVFIIGMPRSGTTLAEQILAGHPQVFGAGELSLADASYKLIPTLVGRNVPGLDCLGQLGPPAVSQLARSWLHNLRAHHATAARIIDKLPDNFKNLGLIATLLPRARVIFMRRDLRDVALSCWMTAFRRLLWTLEEENILERIRGFVRLMEHWRRVLPLPMLEVDYEELVTDTEAVARRMVQFCGLEWDPACLASHETRRVVRTASKVQVREPVYQRSVGRWRRYEPFLGSLFAPLAELQTRLKG